MSDDQEKLPKSVKQTPKPTTDKSGKKVTQNREKTWNRTQPLLKVQSIKALRGAIHLLEGVVEKLEAEPTQQISSSAVTDLPAAAVPRTPIDAPIAAPEAQSVPVDTAGQSPELQDLSISTPIEAAQLEPKQQTPAAESQVAKTPTFVDRFLPSFERLQTWREAALKNVRALLPESLNQKLSDWGLTGIFAGIIVVLLWTSAALLPGKPAEVANVPPAEIKAPPELKAPKSPEPVKIAPPPMPVLTPEQNLIASIQNQVADITNQYAEGLIQSLQANFQGSLLIVKVSEGWYNLNPSKQDKLADEMLRRSQNLDFSKLEITDPEGKLLARSPVVGTHMVILKRQGFTANS